jgi:hypothetical protein
MDVEGEIKLGCGNLSNGILYLYISYPGFDTAAYLKVH